MAAASSTTIIDPSAAAAMMATTNSSQFLQNNDQAAASFHFMDYNSVTPAPIVKSQVAVAGGGEYFNPNTMALQHPPQPPSMDHFMYQPSTFPQQPMMESSNLVNGFHNPMMMATNNNMYPPPSFVSTAAAPISPPYTYDQVIIVKRCVRQGKWGIDFVHRT